MQPEEIKGLEQQVRVSQMLGTGFAFSITGLAGIGSLIALIIGLRALRIINQSNGVIVGVAMAWWCIIMGALGTIISPIAIFLHLTQDPK
jgi:hypothetical protein